MLMTTKGYFACCELCGSLEWQDEAEQSNTLDEDGNMLEQDSTWMMYESILYCHDCENPLFAIPFDKVNQTERKKIYKMSAGRRKKWVKSFQIIEELEII